MSKTIQEQIEVMTYYNNGGETEVYDRVKEIWIKKDIANFNWIDRDYRIKEQKKTITIEKWLMQNTNDLDYFTIETSNIKIAKTGYVDGLVNAIKLLETYEVEL